MDRVLRTSGMRLGSRGNGLVEVAEGSAIRVALDSLKAHLFAGADVVANID